jgi:hypothetical protein
MPVLLFEVIPRGPSMLPEKHTSPALLIEGVEKKVKMTPLVNPGACCPRNATVRYVGAGIANNALQEKATAVNATKAAYANFTLKSPIQTASRECDALYSIERSGTQSSEQERLRAMYKYEVGYI